MKDFLKSALLYIAFTAVLLFIGWRIDVKNDERINTHRCEICGQLYEYDNKRNFGICDECKEWWLPACLVCGKHYPRDAMYNTDTDNCFCSKCFAEFIFNTSDGDAFYEYYGVDR